ncbi:MAG: DEAD/DEAH box helicase, partial [Ktedonobacterales bacterium]
RADSPERMRVERARRTRATRDTTAVSAHVAINDPHNLRLTIRDLDINDQTAQADSPRWYALARRAQDLRVPASFDTLVAPAVLYDRVRPHEYQLRVVEAALREKAPAAILADEVGLGKTIEAGLILKELTLRGIARRVLVLAPKALLGQWQQELREHFDEEFVLTDERRFRGFNEEPRVICSLPQFVRSFDTIGARALDLVIVDEAHLLANPASKRRQRMGMLRAHWRLLLTATPVANKLTDLYSLVDLVAPGRLGTLREFEREFVTDPGTARVLRPNTAADLRRVVAEVMCRTRRSEAAIAFAGRAVTTSDVAATPAEDALITEVTAYLRALYRRLPARGAERGAVARASDSGRLNRGAVMREIMALQQSLSSSPYAIAKSLRARAERHEEDRAYLLELADRCEASGSAKEGLLLAALDELGAEPALIFTLRLETAAHLRETLNARGRRAEWYVGALSRAERERVVARFNAGEIDTLVATDAGAEGLNLQERCHTLFNYDLHWNPMRIEQRIGRVHRLGQKHDVQVHNFVLKDSIDDYVVKLLYQKINLFTMTIGALETVLAESHEGEIDLEERVLEILLRNESRDDMSAAVDALGAEMAQAMGRQHEAELLTTEALG